MENNTFRLNRRGRKIEFEIVAWQSLPEPYEEGEQIKLNI